MVLLNAWSASAIVANEPDSVEQHVRQMGEYLRRFGSFIAHAAVDHPNEFVIALATAVLAIATISLWNSTAALAKFAKEQAIDMKASIAATQKATEAAELSARMATAANNLMGQTAERQLQAYISLSKARIISVEAGQRPTAKIAIRNSGQTPAYDLSAELAIGIGPFPIQKGAKVNPLPTPHEISRLTVGPGTRVRQTAMQKLPLTIDEFNAIKAGQAAIYVAGRIRYRDAFGRGWVNNFRLMYNRRGFESGSWRLEVCEEGNEIKQESGPPQFESGSWRLEVCEEGNEIKQESRPPQA
jgi:hypothetical protein